MELKRAEKQSIDLQKVEIILQLINSIDILSKKLEYAYNQKDSVGFNDYKNEILKFQKKIGGMLD
ncbi:MAG: hypothetical protein AABX77_02235 [Nanoarchaeota archaeon]